MSAAVRPCVVIPVFDHAATVGDVACGAARYVEHVLVVDDGSRDGGPASELRSGHGTIEVLRHARNLGKGEAIRTGLSRAAQLGFTHAVVMDADGQHRATDIPVLLAKAGDCPDDIVVGARDLSGARVPRSSRVGRWVSNFWTLRLTGFDLPDTQSGFRVYPVAPVIALPHRCTRYDFEVEVLTRAAWAGIGLRSVPIDVWYPPPDERVSHFRALADNIRISWTYTRLAVRRLLPTGGAARRAEARPRKSLREGLRWLRDASRSGTRPAELALAVAAGAFIGSTPFWGLHAVLALYVGTRLHLNLVAAFVGSNVSLPFVAPYLILASVECGHLLLRGRLIELDAAALAPSRIPDHLLDYVVGSFPVAAVVALVVGVITLGAATLLRRRSQ